MSLTQSTESSQYLSSSITSLHGSHHRTKKPSKASSEISKTYKHASQLYLTRRLVECYNTLQPVVKPPSHENGSGRNGHSSQSEDEHAKPLAPIASASTSYRIKTWVLYTTLLSAIIELGEDDGKQDFGIKGYREIVRSVQSGDVWEQVVKDGYAGREGVVDAEVVYNLSNLLLAHAPDQTINQQRLETYLSTSLHGSLDISTALYNGTNGHSKNRHSGIDTPKDLNSRIKILELFILHVLPANKEWDYAKSFVQNSDILEEERREALLQTLLELQEAREQEEAELQAEAEEDLVGFAEQTEEEDERTDHGKINMHEADMASPQQNGLHETRPSDQTLRAHSPYRRSSLHRRTSSEVDYGIEDSPVTAKQSQTPTHTESTDHQRQASFPSQAGVSPDALSKHTAPSSATSQSPTLATPASVSTSQTSSESRAMQPTHRSSIRKPIKTPSNTPARKGRISNMFAVLQNLTTLLTQSITKNPTIVFRTLMFLFAFLVVLAKKEVRERLKRVMGHGWAKVLATAKMGGKVSYI